MEHNLSEEIGTRLKEARTYAKITQATLARQSQVKRANIAKIEIGEYMPRLDETLRLAAALKIPLQRLLTGKNYSPITLTGIAFELYHLGIRDLVVDGATVPGAFHRREQVVALALRGDRPEIRLVEAMPVVLATNKLDVGLTLAFANHYDRRVRVRLAWLSDVTLALAGRSTFPFQLQHQEALEGCLKRVKKPKKGDEPDSLGISGPESKSPIWRRWNITYAGTMNSFLQRALDLAQAR